MELTKTVGAGGRAGRRGWAIRLGLFGAAVALTAAVVIPRIGGPTTPAARDQVAAPAVITLTQSETSQDAVVRHQEMLRALGRLQPHQTSSVCLPCIERQQLSQLITKPPAE
jgi:hypothetical protein